MKETVFLYNSGKPILPKQYPPQFVSQVGMDGIMAPTDCIKQVDPPPHRLIWLLYLSSGSQKEASVLVLGRGKRVSLASVLQGATWQPISSLLSSWNSSPLYGLQCSSTVKPGTATRKALKLSCPEALVPRLQKGRASVFCEILNQWNQW